MAAARALPSTARMAASQQSSPPARSGAPLQGVTQLGQSIQAKLGIGPVDDPLEREADQVADHVMRMPADDIADAPPQVSCKCAECEEEEKLQKKETVGPQAATSVVPDNVHNVLRSPGQPLDDATRAYFEPRFGRDFSGVRVHTGTAAEQSVRGLNAWAYTVGSDIAFATGRFDPKTHRGRRLLAHELTHVLQQSGGACGTNRMPGAQTKLSIGEPGDRYEQEAERVAETEMQMPDSLLSRTATRGSPPTSPLFHRITSLVQREATATEEQDDDEEEVALQRYGDGASKRPRVSLQSRPKIMKLTPERFRKRLARTDDLKKVIDALFENNDFKTYWEWLGDCGEKGAHGPIKLRVRRTWEEGTQTFGEFKWSTGTLIINPRKREAIANPQEMVDTIVHELFHAIHWAVDAGKCPEKEPPLERIGYKRGSKRDDEVREGHATQPNLKDVKGTIEEIAQFEKAGPSASDPCRAFIDILESPQRAVVKIVSETIEQTRIGGSTRTRANEILRQDICNARNRGAASYGEFLKQAPVLAEFIACRDEACFTGPCPTEVPGMECPLRPRRNRERDIEACFHNVLASEPEVPPDACSSSAA